MVDFVVSALEKYDAIEVVERKGIGHPDTICDALAETLSSNLVREYRRRFGRVLHYNVDKALLCGGRSKPAFGSGKVIEPIRIYLAGRATSRVGGEIVPIEEMALEGSRAWLKANMHALDAERDVRIETVVHEGSQDLRQLFARAPEQVGAAANDTSIGIGYAPLSALERFVIALEKRIHDRDRAHDRPAWGEDIKIMAIRRERDVRVTMACAMIGRYLADMDEYLDQKRLLQRLAGDTASEYGLGACHVTVNAADEQASGNIYLTVTGTSAEAGDDGQVGRGNRVNGLITPCRPMSLEAAAGKNPFNHVGKIYNLVAREICESIVAAHPEVDRSECLLVSEIGSPVCEPSLVHVKIAPKTGATVERLKTGIERLVSERLRRLALDDFDEVNVF